MSEIRRANRRARRRVMILAGVLLVLVLIGTVGYLRYHGALIDWILADPARTGRRVRIVLLTPAVLLALPLIAFGIRFWTMGSKSIRTKEFPPPGVHVLRDTPVVRGNGAASRGQALRIVALGLTVAAIVVCTLVWQTATTVVETIS
ncbi:MAG: hypothetical protein GC151_16490 [Betaproteobacteria bacterium]|nr:hypothetical protein [Betaproteobacteria bacterium]